MASTDINGSPILILGVEDVKLIKVCVSLVQGLDVLGDVSIKNPEKFKKLSEKLDKFLKESA